MSNTVCLDKTSVERATLLHPKLRAEALQILTECTERLKGRATVRFTHTLRTFNEQLRLYNQGRSLPGKRVTNAGPGQSMHNYGLAVDICLVVDGKTAVWDIKTDFDNDLKADWMECVDVFKKYGWEWGGSWKFVDYPHFQKTYGYTWKPLLSKHSAGKVDEKGYVMI